MKYKLRKKHLVFIAAVLGSGAAYAAETVKIGLILPMSGPFAATGKQIENGVRLYMQQHGTNAGGKKIEVIMKDDGGVQPEVTKQLAQALILQDKVDILAGFGLTPLALAVAPLATQSKTPTIIMSAGASVIPSKSPYIIRTSFTVAQNTAPLADWAAKNKEFKSKTAITLVTNYGPGHDAEKTFVKRFADGGGKVLDTIRVPLQNPDFAPFMQKVKDEKPDALFVFVPAGVGTAILKQYREKGLAEAGIKLIATGDVMDDDVLPSMGSEAIGVISSHHYSTFHESPENKNYVDAYKKSFPGMRPNYMSVGGYDGMHIIYEALKKTKGDASGEKLIEAMKGFSWLSPRGPASIDAQTRDIVQTVYIRKTEQRGKELANVEFEKVDAVKDPLIE